jgi:hypothetical protein
VSYDIDEQIRIEKAIYARAADDGAFAIAYALIQAAAALHHIAEDDNCISEALRAVSISIDGLKGSSE